MTRIQLEHAIRASNILYCKAARIEMIQLANINLLTQMDMRAL